MNTSKQELLDLIERIKQQNFYVSSYRGPDENELHSDPVLKELWEQYAVYATLKGIPIK
jgi:hypothetical protein